MTPSTASEFAADTDADPSTVDATLDSSLLMNKLHDTRDAVVKSLRPKVEAVSNFARNDPTKAMLISAATGAALMGLIALMARSPRRSVPMPRRSTLASIRDAALDLADRAQSAATSVIDAARQRASEAGQQIDAAKQRIDDVRQHVGDAQDRAAEAADAVADKAAEAWKSLREQAAPVVDRLRPHIAAATAYAKEDPARVAIGVAAAGAVLVGLLALIRKSESD
jgi:ElaB/YqjD/DUF883 family membrane-anchored ribosome-binding protein